MSLLWFVLGIPLSALLILLEVSASLGASALVNMEKTGFWFRRILTNVFDAYFSEYKKQKDRQ